MNEIAEKRIAENIKKENKILELSNLDLTYLELPFNKLDHVLHINLEDNHLTELPENIGDLKNVQILDFTRNKITFIPESFNKLQKLRELHLDANSLVSFDNLNKLSRAIFINLSGNYINDIVEDLKELVNLFSLNLSYNELTNIPNSFQVFNRLKILDLSGNNIENINNDLTLPEDLAELRLSNNNIKDFSFSYIKNVRRLYLDSNYISIFPKDAEQMTDLAVLDMSDNVLSEIPEEVIRLRSVEELNLSYNLLKSLPEKIGNMDSLSVLYLNDNQIETLPKGFGGLYSLKTLSISNNKLKTLPQSVTHLHSLQSLQASNNNLATLPRNFSRLNSLGSLSLRFNKLESFPKELKLLEENRPEIILDYRDNPFGEKEDLYFKSFNEVWKSVPTHLRELLKIYFSGFNIFFKEKTNCKINLQVINDDDSFAFKIIEDNDNDPKVVSALLNEYFEILKNKIEEAAKSGQVTPNFTADTATFFAEMQVSSFALNANHVRVAIEGYVPTHELYSKLSGSLDEMTTGYRRVINTVVKTTLALQQEKEDKRELKGQLTAQGSELHHRRLESHTRASRPTPIEVNQYVMVNQQVGTDFDKVRELLDPYLTDFQRRTGSEIQKEIDALTDKPNVSPDEKKSIGVRLKRWLDGVSETFGSGKKVIENAGELIKYLDKAKTFSESVLHNADVKAAIESLEQMLTSGS